jgi:hypothetical protein
LIDDRHNRFEKKSKNIFKYFFACTSRARWPCSFETSIDNNRPVTICSFIINPLTPFIMGNIKLNALVEKASGRVGSNLVLRTRGKRTILATNGERSKEVTEKQKVVRERFRLAAAYAKAALKNPETKTAYEDHVKDQEFMSAFTAAVKDYLKPPQIAAVTLDGYTGQPGSVIQIRPVDDFKVIGVTVKITAPDGTVIESGNAVLEDEFKYTATQVNAALPGTKITITATDRPGNGTTEERTL